MKFISDKEYKDLLERANRKVDNSYHTDQIEKLERSNKILKEDHDIYLKRKDDEVDQLIYKATKERDEKINVLTIEKNNATKEAEILTKAFENLGFDVKDMKDILNKLVDGIVSKNQIQLVK